MREGLHKRGLVQGHGLNDADYMVKPVIEGKKVCCPFYRAWTSMLYRCYNSEFHKNQPTYGRCTVEKEWLLFSNFKAWMEKQPWEGNQLDKDILKPDNKTYGPTTCVFISSQLNKFLTDRSAVKGERLIGCSWHSRDKKFGARCWNPFTRKREELGYFTNELDAHLAWKKQKHQHALAYADLQSDKRVANALRTRHLN